MNIPTTLRIVLVGKSGNGKSSLANTIFGETVFKANVFDDSKGFSQVNTKCISGKSIALIDSPGLFDPGRSEKEIQPELMRFITECAPGPHVFLIVLKVEKFTKQQQAVISEICEVFPGDSLKFAAVVFTHGDQLPEEMKITEYVDQSEELKDLVAKCGGRCHVFDCKYWKNKQEDDYRSNQFQLVELLSTLDKILMENTGGHYTNTVIDQVEREIQEEEERIKETSQNASKQEIRKLAKRNVFKKLLKGSKPLWIQIGLVVTSVLVVISAVWIGSMGSPLELQQPTTGEDIWEVEEVAEESTTPENIFDFFERIYNPFD